MNIDEDVYLKHYGVPGMKWGVRKARRAEENLVKTKARQEAKATPITRDEGAIRNARTAIKSAESNYTVKKAEARVVRQTEGKDAAKKLVREARLERKVEYIKNYDQASVKTTSELVTDMLLSFGNIALNSRR